MLAATWRIRHLVDAAMATRLEHHVDPQSNNFVWYVLISVFLVALAGLMSGLTLGLLSLDEMSLEVLKRSGTEQEQRYAEKIIPVIARPHHLLVTLVLMNAMATEALPIFLDRLINPVTAVIVSIVVVLIFGEVLPQAACTKYGLAVGAHAAWFVKLLMVLTSPIAYPCSLLLDLALGSHRSAIMRRRQLKVLVEVHAADEGLGGNLTADEIFVIQGALDLSRKAAAQACTPLDKTFMLSTDAILDEDTMQTVLSSGHSRIPVYEGKNRGAIVGALFVKELAWLDKSAGIPVATLKLRSIPTLPADMPCYDLLRLFQTGRSHMAVLVQPPEQQPDVSPRGRGESWTGADGQVHLWVQADHIEEEHGPMRRTVSQDPWQQAVRAAKEEDKAAGVPIGIITLEDILEELLQREIVDETDQYVDNNRSTRVNAANILHALPPHLKAIVQGKMFQPRVGRLAAVNARGNLNETLQHTSYTPTSTPPPGRVTLTVGSTAGGEMARPRRCSTCGTEPGSSTPVSHADVRAAIDALTPLLADQGGDDASCGSRDASHGSRKSGEASHGSRKSGRLTSELGV
mmetsp:Transcript_4479/g.12914  ORF Transcript_4479/g.12914 Transcript_4479/m.12914 type:complete len:574 (+) Transcript_4479:397-2118(+)|eukprot:CAMPEP_0206139722 /NCGR_PEP_ID=MMETSP1473-20131121/7029_1 /ASSEMBLY_ACC=CAM_ASM_001109 /TAXON_ID=1461547 /ORGANISM="Stichococcus sp, Strain RCC1054" /LENGTH=573 /DNA_ID=CAMNT_0053533611 /DNA_START=308 /DNA_END=2029 /DNA_ORIENTATION=+